MRKNPFRNVRTDQSIHQALSITQSKPSQKLSVLSLVPSQKWIPVKTAIDLKEDDLVMAKMKSFCPWPARIIRVKGKRTDVFFFGTNQTGTVDTNQIRLFCDCSQEIKRLLLRHNLSFIKAVKEVEVILKIPDNLSILNEKFIQ